MISITFLILASISNAIMDVSAHHYYNSIFFKYNKPSFFNSEISWRNKYIDFNPKNGRRKILNTSIDFPVQFTDLWHFAKMLMIIFLCASIVTFDFDKYLLLIFVGYGIIWNKTFSLFYDKLLVMSFWKKKDGYTLLEHSKKGLYYLYLPASIFFILIAPVSLRLDLMSPFDNVYHYIIWQSIGGLGALMSIYHLFYTWNKTK